MTDQNETPINATVDFERAKERLEHAAGKLFSAWRSLKGSGTAAEAEVQAAHRAYITANDRAKDLRVTDHDAIRAILEAKA